MNYANIYENAMRRFQKTTPRERLIARNKEDDRLIYEFIYTENHHIIPRAMGGTSDIENMVRLLPEEHLWAHSLRYKAYKDSCDMLAVRFMLNSFASQYNKNKFFIGNIKMNKTLRKGYVFMRLNAIYMRKVGGWQSEDGLNRISAARKNMIPVKDAKTGEVVGAVEKTHEKYVSGEWVHVTKNTLSVYLKETMEKIRITSDEYKLNKEKYTYIIDNSCENNSRWLNISEDDKIREFTKFCRDIGMIVGYGLFIKISRNEKNGYKRVCNFRIYDTKDIHAKVLEETKLPYMIKKAYSKKERELFLNGHKTTKEYLNTIFDVDFSMKTINYPATHNGKGKRKNDKNQDTKKENTSI